MYHKDAKQAVSELPRHVRKNTNRKGVMFITKTKLKDIDALFERKGFYKHKEQGSWSKYLKDGKERIHFKYKNGRLEWHYDYH